MSVRSILPEETIETKITQVTLASYDGYGKLTDARYYGGHVRDMHLNISAKGSSNVYALVNMGDMTRTVPASDLLWRDSILHLAVVSRNLMIRIMHTTYMKGMLMVR